MPRLRKEGSGWELEDLKSTNGTTLNGQVVLSAPIGPGDELRIGRALIVFEDLDAVDGRLIGPSEAKQASGMQQSLMQSLASGPSSFMEGISSGRNVPMLAIGGEDAGRKSDIAVVNVELGRRSHCRADDGLGPPGKRYRSRWRQQTVLPAESAAERKLQLIQQVSEKLIRIFEPEELLKEILAIVIAQTARRPRAAVPAGRQSQSRADRRPRHGGRGLGAHQPHGAVAGAQRAAGRADPAEEPASRRRCVRWPRWRCTARCACRCGRWIASRG